MRFTNKPLTPDERLKSLQIESNTGTLPYTSLRWLKPLPASASDEEIRTELYNTGVVHIKGVVPKDVVLETRKR